MLTKASIISKFAERATSSKTSVLVSVKLLNKDELNILIEGTSTIIDKFYIMF